VRFTINDFNTVAGDKLSIYDGNSATNTGYLLFGWDGALLPTPSVYESTQGNMTLVFITDSAGVSTGFRGIATQTCTPLSRPRYYAKSILPISFSTPLALAVVVGGNYPSSLTQTWKLPTVNTTNCMQINFSSFITELNTDIVTLSSVTGTKTTVLGTYSGTLSPFTVKTTGPQLLVKFVSNASNNYSGFSALVDPVSC